VANAPDNTAAIDKLTVAANLGTESLKSAWVVLSKHEQHAIGNGKGCPQSFKDIAAKADAPPPANDMETLNEQAASMPEIEPTPEPEAATIETGDDGDLF